MWMKQPTQVPKDRFVPPFVAASENETLINELIEETPCWRSHPVLDSQPFFPETLGDVQSIQFGAYDVQITSQNDLFSGSDEISDPGVNGS